MEEWLPASQAISFLTTGAAWGLAILGEPFIDIWIGPEYGVGGRWVIIFLAASLWLGGAFSNSSRVLVAAGKHGPAAKKVFLISVVAILLSIPAIKIWSVSGVALILLLADSAAIRVFWMDASKYIGIGLSEHLQITIKPLLVPLACLLSGLVAGRLLIDISSYSNLLAVAVIGISLYFAAAWLFMLKSHERKMIRLRMREIPANSIDFFKKKLLKNP